MRTVQSVVCTEFGDSEKIKVQDFPLKDLQQNEIEVEVHYCGLNFADLYTRLGLFPKDKPFILGIECSGIVTSIDSNVTQFKVGDRVVCYDYNGGIHREIIHISPSKCYRIPDGLSLKVACGAFVAFLTAHCCLFELGNVSAGQNILIQSAAGSVGQAAAQLSRTIPDITLWGTVSNVDKISGGIFDHILSYKDINDIPDKQIDILIDNQVCGDYKQNLRLLRPFGKIVVIGANYMIKNNELCVSNISSEDVLSRLIMNSLSVSGLHLGIVVDSAKNKIDFALQHIWNLIKSDKVKVQIDSVHDFTTEGVRNGTNLLQNRKNKSKVLLKTKYAADDNQFLL